MKKMPLDLAQWLILIGIYALLGVYFGTLLGASLTSEPEKV